MKPRFSHIVLLLLSLILVLGTAIPAAEKQNARAIPITTGPLEDIRFRTNLSAADTCNATMHDSLVWQITGWVIGNELYKNYINPAVSCPNPYPYTVNEINMVMGFAAATTLIVSVDIEEADMTNPACPVPGVLIDYSSSWDITISNPGLYNIWIPLDSPITVNEPFFAGFYIGNAFDAGVNPSIIPDDNSAAVCASYNIWDTTIGFVDLNNNTDYNFPGRLVVYVSGTTGGVDLAPEISIVTPYANQKLFGKAEILTMETTGSSIIDYVQFEYSDGGDFIEFDRDYDGYSPLRDEINDAGIGNGFHSEWDFSLLPEGTYTIRVTVMDTLGRSASDQIAVYLEPTPPVPSITSYADGMPFCDPLNLTITVPDENLTDVEAFLKPAVDSFSIGLTPVAFPSTTPGFSAAVAAAQAIQIWSGRICQSYPRYTDSPVYLQLF